MKRPLVCLLLLCAASAAPAPGGPAARARIFADITAMNARVTAAQARLKDSCSLTDYAARARSVNGTNVWTEAFRAALREHEIVRIPAGEWWLDGTVVVPSNRRIEATGATVRLMPSVKTVLLRNEHAQDGTRKPVDASVRDENIAVVGGRWEDWSTRRAGYGRTGCFNDGPRASGTNYYGVSALFYFGNAKGVSVERVTFAHVGSFAFQSGDVEDIRFDDIRFDRCFADGLHLNGNTRNLHIRNVRGMVGDDLVALNVYDWQNSSVNFGPMDTVLCEDVTWTHGYPAFRIEPGIYTYADGSTVDCAFRNAVIRRVKGIRTFKMYLQTPRYEIGKEPERGAVGSGSNIWFEDLDVDLDRPIDGFAEYTKSDPLRGHFAAFEIGANFADVHFRNICLTMHADRYPLSHLVCVGPKSCVVSGGPRKSPYEIFDPYVSCHVGEITVEDLKVTGELKEPVRCTVFENIDGDGRSTGRGTVGKVTVSRTVTVPDTVVFDECARCPRRFRVAADGSRVTVNVARLKDDAPDTATFEKRKADIAARARTYLRRAAARPNGDPNSPLMGWSSWNTFGVDISEEIILDTARAMATNGLKEAGYRYVNIDDGFFNGHDGKGRLRFHPRRFPRGMKGTVDGIHALGLLAGIYSDAGADTCGSMWGGSGTGGKDAGGVGAGLYGHDAADCRLHFNELGFDFIKVDYCGGGKLRLNERARYTEIARAIRATGRTDVRFNICRWAFPGTWAADIAGSWRTTGDIRANWKSIRDILAENLYLSAYARPGRFNDMDMLEVGQLKGVLKTIFGSHGDTGITPEEESTHFGMWCMMSSPLLIGCDVRTIPASTLALITNPYLVQMNQNAGLGLQGEVVARDGSAYVLAKDADTRFGTSRYVALCNAGDAEHAFTVRAETLELAGTVAAFDLVDRADIGTFTGEVTVKVPAHGSRFYRFDADRRVERTVYEAEAAYLSEYQELRDPVKAGTAFAGPLPGASAGVAVRYLGNRETNDLVWKDVRVVTGGRRTLTFLVAAPEARGFFVQIDGGAKVKLGVAATGGAFVPVEMTADLAPGIHEIRLSNPSGWAPDVDLMRLR